MHLFGELTNCVVNKCSHMHRKIFSYSMCARCLFKIFFMHLYACMEFLHCSKFQLKWFSSVLSISGLKWSLIPMEQVTVIQILTRTKTWLNQMIMGWELANLIFCFCYIDDQIFFFFFWNNSDQLFMSCQHSHA